MVMLPFPLDEPSANQYELAGRFIAATILVERVLDAVLLHYVAQDPVNATMNVRKVLRRLNLDAKCDLLAEFVEQQQETHAYSELPAKVKRVVQHRHRFAHMLFTRDERGGLHFLDELTKTRQSFTAEQQATIEREALEAQQGLASLVNSVAAV